jgi:choline transport protein
VVAIIVVTLCSALLALINIGNNVAFNGTISLVLEGFYISYLLAIGMLLWRRIRGDMDSPDPVTSFNSTSNSDEAMDSQLRWGPWRLKGFWGTANNIVAICYLLLLIFFSFWPNYLDVSDPASMNWAVLVTGFIMIFSIGYYLIWARKTYTGPIVETNFHRM